MADAAEDRVSDACGYHHGSGLSWRIVDGLLIVEAPEFQMIGGGEYAMVGTRTFARIPCEAVAAALRQRDESET